MELRLHYSAAGFALHRRTSSATTTTTTTKASSSPANFQPFELSVCVNRTCGRQGSREIMEIFSALAPPHVMVNSCGCLGRCGAGPNVVILPHRVIVGHCGTAASAARLIEELCGKEGCFDAEASLNALALRKRAEKELEKGDFAQAEILLTQAVDLKPAGGLQFIHRSRSIARLNMGDYARSLEDAEEASCIDPKYPQAHLAQGDALLAMEKLDAAEKAFSTALLIDPSIRRSKSFKALVAKLQEKMLL